ncbi:MAG: glutamine--fructose-6-phosphate transaminase (isomerizing) [Deltaproteobacteria bacterium]|nr:glutamine--fructose-6-phosphate transaminase (isomerizing) [Deltaproteobacteria bacterium]
MCGIVGYIGERDCTPVLIEGLRRLEYRGYDSAGVAVWDRGESRVIRCRGKLGQLEELLKTSPLVGRLGIGHTRWATHGRPSDENAHPHKVGSVSVVHNGIIENHVPLRAELVAQGRKFSSETDTEIIAHLVDAELAASAPSLAEAVRRALAKVRGAYAIVVMSDRDPGCLVAAKNASPLVLGLGQGENFVASDIPAVLPYTRRMMFLEEGEVAVVTRTDISLMDLNGAPVTRPPREITWSAVQAEKAGYRHFMLKEIHEQPRAVTDTLRGRLDLQNKSALLDDTTLEPSQIRKIFLVACGTSYHASLIGKFWIEQMSRVPVEVDLASEFRYRDPVVTDGDLLVAISQSGETADTLAALKEARGRGARTLAISNVLDASIPRAAHSSFYTHAGPEIGVASTKAFSTQLVSLLLLAIHLGRRAGTLPMDTADQLLAELLALPAKMKDVIDQGGQMQVIARRYGHARGFLFLGRGTQYPIALEGALKLKEISYIHAEGYPAGEMKHGPIALIDSELPVVVLAPKGPYYEKTLSNLSEVRAREGKVIVVATRGDHEIGAHADEVVFVPETVPEVAPLLTVLPLQLLAYHVAVLKGTDVDQPRNLAKSVTVE